AQVGRHAEAVRELFECRGVQGIVLAALVVAEAALGEPGQGSDLALGDPVHAQDADKGAQVAPLAGFKGVLTCENGFKPFPQDLLV
ncbi:MAG TPA: hypothetical protein VKV02_03595, partial [Acidobacteriaceae bacterium]|nr:hypothetical protein [Acidobacteriaceae bacterium]